jgi:hypothetical protein
MDEQVIPILRVTHAANAAACYERIGFEKSWELPLRDPDGNRLLIGTTRA